MENRTELADLEHGFGNRFRITIVILVCFEEGFDVLAGNQADVMAKFH